MTTRTRKVILALFSLLVIGGLVFVAGRILLTDGGPDVDDGRPTPTTSTVSGIRLETASLSADASGSGQARLQIRLSKGEARPDTVQALPAAEGTPLSAAEVQQILDRVPSLSATPGDVAEFRLPDELLPPPRPGQTITEPFPPPTVTVTPEAVATGPLEVVRFSPEGEIPLAPFLNVTFNQPMVPLATVEQLTAQEVPVRLSPSLPGVWKWLGTKTLTFEYQSDEIDRFPMATEYTVEVPAGTESATGGTLAEPVTWTFNTPPPQMQTHYPSGGPQGLEPVFFVAFDQRIDPAAVLDTIGVTADGQEQALRPATEEEVTEDKTVSRLVENASEGRWLAFRAQQALPAAANVVVTVGPGTPSAEGPLVTEEAQSFNFNTYSPLSIVDHGCSWSDDCPPFSPLFIRFNNPLDQETFAESMLRISPELPDATVTVAGRSITIQGATRGRTTYAVTVSGEVQDVFDQMLGRDQTLRFRIGSAPPSLTGPNQDLVTLDPSTGKPLFTVYSINYDRLRVRAYAVAPADWPAYQEYVRNFYPEEERPDPPGREVMNEAINVDAVDDVLTETAIDLSQALDGDTGHLVVVVEPPQGLLSLNRNRDRQIIRAWVQVTQIGLDAFVDHSQMVVWTSDLQDGSPLSGADLSLSGADLSLGNVTAVTGTDGVARLDLPSRSAVLLVARRNGDTAILPPSPNARSRDGWRAQPLTDELRWYVFDDRQMYRPGEEVHVKGWMRRVGSGQNGDVGLLDGAVTAVRYWVTGPQGNEFLTGEAEVNALGGFDLVFTLPENSNLGYASLNLDAVGGGSLSRIRYSHNFQIQEFRRPEFEVSARTETPGPYFVGEEAVVAVSANYFAGGPLPNADVTWNVTSSPGSYRPPNWPDFTFGRWTPWWIEYGPIFEAETLAYDYYGPEVDDRSMVETFTGVTDAGGEHYLNLDFEEADKPQPFSVRAEATVMDVNRQAWAAATNLLVHPADLYVGLRSQRTFVEQGTPLEVDVIVTDLDGNPVAGRPVEVQAARMEWRYNQGRWGEEPVEAQTCTLESAEEPVTCSFTTDKGGTYQITATVSDDQGRLNQSQFRRWVSGGQRPPARNVEQEEVVLIPDKETYQPGDVAEILVQAPFSPAEGLLTVSRSGFLTTARFDMAEGSHTLRVPIEEAHLPNLNVQVDLVGSAPRTDDAGDPVPDVPPRPAYASGRLNLPISTRSRTLSLQVTPQEASLAPGGETAIDVAVVDANGQPVADAEVAVVVVDEAILALTNYQLADPVAAFYQMRGSGVSSYYGRATIVLANPELLGQQALPRIEATMPAMAVTEGEAMMEAPMEEAAADMAPAPGLANAAPEPIRVRTDFNPLATFAPAARTDGNGRAQVAVQLPDNLTRYRVMAVAVTGQQFGHGESNLTARLPLMVRPSAPRFLNFGDQFELPVVLQNQTDEDMTVDVAVQASNVALTGEAGQRVSVPANGRVEVRFPATTDRPGTARFQIAAVSGPYADAATVELPVYTPATTEAFATYGVIDEGAILQPVSAPDGVFPQFGGLEINTSSTALQALTDAVLYLVSYRYECSEQLASRILAVAALRDVLTAFEAEGLPTPAEMEAAVQRDIEQLQGLQNNDGGFPIWRRGRESVPFYTIHVAHALQRARMKGFEVPEEMMQRSLTYLRDIESHYPPRYSQRMRRTLSAYALNVRQLMGDVDADKAARLFDDAGLEELTLEAVAWLWPVLDTDSRYAAQVEAIGRHLNNRAVETAAAANFTTSYGDDAYLMLHSNRRTDGIILDALITVQPDSDLIPKVVNGLLAHRTRGRWYNTQENVFILLALDHYFNTFESQTPDFVARVWLGDTYAGSHEFVGRTTERHETEIPMRYLVGADAGDAETQDLIVSKEGPGRLYYRLGLSYAPDDLDLDPLDRGFIVERTYEAVDDPGDVTRDEDGVWHIRAGARVRVRLKMVANNRRYHVALVDPLPAGLEIVNPALAVAQDSPPNSVQPSGGYSWWWWRNWYQHQNMRDERAEAFTTLLWEGVYDYAYVARATTPGTFVVPPAKAEEMYAPEVFGRSGSDLVVVE